MTLLRKLDRLPPCLCRLLAQRNGELMTDRQLIRLTGWSKVKLERICKALSWARICVSDVDDFLFACGLRWSAQRRERWLLKVATEKGVEGLLRMRHLRWARKSDVTVLLKRYMKVVGNSQ